MENVSTITSNETGLSTYVSVHVYRPHVLVNHTMKVHHYITSRMNVMWPAP